MLRPRALAEREVERDRGDDVASVLRVAHVDLRDRVAVVRAPPNRSISFVVLDRSYGTEGGLVPVKNTAWSRSSTHQVSGCTAKSSSGMWTWSRQAGKYELPNETPAANKSLPHLESTRLDPVPCGRLLLRDVVKSATRSGRPVFVDTRALGRRSVSPRFEVSLPAVAQD